MKQAVFLIVSYGVDGREPESIVFASTNETERDAKFSSLLFPEFYSKRERVIDMEERRRMALLKLDGLDCCAMGLPSGERLRTK